MSVQGDDQGGHCVEVMKMVQCLPLSDVHNIKANKSVGQDTN